MIIKFPKLTPDEKFELYAMIIIILVGAILTLCFITV